MGPKRDLRKARPTTHLQRGSVAVRRASAQVLHDHSAVPVVSVSVRWIAVLRKPLASRSSFALKQLTAALCPALHLHTATALTAAALLHEVASSTFMIEVKHICLVAVLGVLAVTAEATVASLIPDAGSPEPNTQPGQVRLPAYPDPMSKRVGANWTCYEGWDVTGDIVYVGPDEDLEYTTVSTLQDCQAASCPRGVRNYVGEPVNYCIGEFVVFDKTSGQCWRKINWGCGFTGATAKTPSLTACIQNRPGLLKRVAQCDNLK